MKTTTLLAALFLLCTSYIPALNRHTIAKLTRYEVTPDYHDQFHKALSDYVGHSIAAKKNIMSETYYERENPAILWLIERWESKTALDQSKAGTTLHALETQSKEALAQPVKSFYVHDLEPLSKQQWRTKAKKEDTPFTVMLFVDAKPGTQDTFKKVYHVAMPQFRSEPGVITYQLSQLEEDETQFVTYEKFRSDAAFQYHLKFPHIQPIIDFLESSIKQKPFQNGLHNLVQFAPLAKK